MNIRMIPLHEIKPYANNVKKHPIKQLEAICNSITQFGFRQPIVIDKNNVIIAGHARYEAATTLGLNEVPCEYADNLTDKQVKAYRILDNKIAEMGATDINALSIELAQIPDFNFKEFNMEFSPVNIDIPDVKEPIEEEIKDKCLQCNGTGYLD